MARQQRRPALMAIACGLTACLLLSASTRPARALGAVWHATRAGDDAANGSMADREGTLRFVLGHAAAGDSVRIGDVGEFIDVSSTLVVPAQVAVGAQRDEPCGSYTRPLTNIRATDLVSPVLRIGGGATLRNVDIVGGRVGVLAAGPEVDVCGTGIGVAYEPGADPPIAIPEVKPPSRAAIIIDGERATVHQSYLNGPVVVNPVGSDTRIGDAVNGSGEGNAGVRAATVSVLSNGALAARRVTIRDPFPRALQGIVGGGVPGGDDEAGHANAWVQTPVISQRNHRR